MKDWIKCCDLNGCISMASYSTAFKKYINNCKVNKDVFYLYGDMCSDPIP